MTTSSSIEERIARLEGSFEQIERRLGTLEQDLRSLRVELIARFDRLESRLDQLGGRVEDVDARSNTRIDRLMYWQLGLLGAIAASIVVTVLTRLL
jgi:tetrahydromethanopterin S-methyltransferase subunit G